ncbi:MAG TPA: hypothetical protein VFO60_10400 [Candidatus Dormibacteraeota bacterium]|nr:hypothetical protein [Candidatus Dormibacteraeota bacterium]
MRARIRPECVLLPVEVVLAAVVLGLPNLGLAADFLRGGYPTGATVVAAVSLLLWSVIVLACAGLVIVELRRAARRVVQARLGMALVLLVSLLVLTGGVVRHARSGYSMCCGSLTEAHDLAGDAP